MSVVELPPPTDPTEIAYLRRQVRFKYKKGDLLMAMNEKNPIRWELVKVLQTFVCWLLDEYAAVYLVSYANGQTRLCAEDDIRTLSRLLKTHRHRTTMTPCGTIPKLKDFRARAANMT